MTRFFVRLLLTLLPLSALAAPAGHFFDLNTGDLRAELADAKNDGKKALMVLFVNLPLDIHGSLALKDPRGRETTEKTYAQALKIKATPTFIFYDLGGAEIVRIVGPLQSAEEFLLLGHFVASGAYRSRTFAQFKLEKPPKGS